jgi:metallo-beta-lactamase class B
MKLHVTFALAVMGVVGVASAGAQPAATAIDAHLAAAKLAAGFEFPGSLAPHFPGLLAALCIAPMNAPPPDVAPAPPPPNRRSWYTEPAKVFDDVYFVGTKDRSSWALTTSDGIILIDTSFEYESEEVIVGGLKKLGLDPATAKYVIISHAHPGEVGGAKLMQDRFGSRLKRDFAVADSQKITLGGRTATLIPMPGHTPGTLSMIFEVKDNGTPRTVAFSGGTEFNFVNDVPHFDTYINSARKFAAAAAAAGATVLMTNQSEYDDAASKIKMLAARRPGEPHPFDLGGDAVQRYFKVFDECAQVARLKLLR